MKNRKKNKKLTILIIVILVISIGFALLSTTLGIYGTSSILNNRWGIHWDDESIVEGGNVEATTSAYVSDEQKQIVEFAVDFDMPGDFYEFTVDAINEGTINGEITNITKGVYESDGETTKELPSYLEYSLTYADGEEPQIGDVINAGQRKKYKVVLKFKDSATTVPSTTDVTRYKIEITYEQTKSSPPAPDPTPAIEEPVDFSSDSWETVQKAVQDDNLDAYSVGDTKEFEMDLDNDQVEETYSLRIVNKTTPVECSEADFSQSACGFVVELVEGLPNQDYNPERENCGISGNCSTGGWGVSQLHNYLNNNFYNSLPSGLKNIIISTRVVSGHNSIDPNNFTSTDNIYIISAKEVYNYNLRFDSAATTTRQLDYYHNLGVDYNTGNVDGAKKALHYWTRSYPSNSTGIYFISTSGWMDIRGANQTLAAYPLFRIG